MSNDKIQIFSQELDKQYYNKTRRKFTLTKERKVAMALATITFLTTLTGCSSQKSETKVSNDYSVTQSIVEDTSDKIEAALPEANDEIVDTATIMLLLDILAKEDENGKISSDVISQFKSNIDADDMINEFNSFLDIIEQKVIKEGKVEKVSSILPEELNNDKIILSNIETILENIIKYSKENNKDSVVTEYNKLYKLFVEEKEIELNGTEFEVRDLTYASRTVANMYAETANYYSRNYISEDKYEKMNKRTNDQNNKAYLKSTLEILDNQMEEVSEVDVISLFDKKYQEIGKLLNGKVNLSQDTIKNLVNYINLKYLDSDKVARKDLNQIVGEYDDDKLSDIITAVSAINTYNLKNQKSIIPYSAFLVDEYLKTNTGATDKIALDFVQYNSIMFTNTMSNGTDYDSLKNNPYFENIFKYFTKQDFTHIQTDENGKEINNKVMWQNISDGVHFINYQTVLVSINKLPSSEIKDNYIGVIQENFGQSIQYIQNTIMDECKKVDAKEYVKTK